MNLKMKVKSYSFWVSLASALILILKLVGQKFGFTVDEGLISDLFTSLCAILVILGIIVVPSSVQIEQKTDFQKVEAGIKDVSSQIIENESAHCEVVVAEKKDQEKDLNNEIIELKKEEIKNENVTDESKIEIIEPAETTEIKVENVEETTEEKIVDVSNKMDINIQDFIDKVCIKRAELSNNVLNFVDFLQNELNNIKNGNN